MSDQDKPVSETLASSTNTVSGSVNASDTANKSGSLNGWLNQRFPFAAVWRASASEYYVPKNLNFWYFFGVFSLLVLVNQFVTGIWLTMYYTPTASGAFISVEHIMRNVKYGWLLRYMHSTGASAFFVVIYLHMYRCLMYGSYKRPRELLWLFGMVLYVLLMAEAFTGYVLPWGQMSFWATKVITSFFKAIPLIGDHLAIWIQGDYSVSGITLHRFFSFHVIALPLTLVAMVAMHLIGLHHVGSNNPKGIEIRDKVKADGTPKDGIPFHPYYSVKDFLGVVIFFIIFALVVFVFPTVNGYFLEPANFIPANPLVTPAHIAPVWYFAPFYAMLRAVPSQLGGISTMGAAIAVLFVLPWFDRSPVRSLRYKGVFSKISLSIFVVSFMTLGYLGTQPVSPICTLLAQIFTVGYFQFFLLMPFYTAFEGTKTPPERL